MAQSLKDRIVAGLVKWLMTEKYDHPTMLTDFERIRFEIRPCDVLLIEGSSRVSNVIKAITQSTWSHAALYMGRLHDIENPVLRERVREFCPPEFLEEQLVIESLLGKGTAINPISLYKNAHIRICRPVGLDRQDAQKVIGYTIGRLGVEYDIRQILDLARLLLPWSILPRHWRSTLFKSKAGTSTRMICSTLIAEAFRSVRFPILPVIQHNLTTGVELIPRNPRLYTPSDFDYSPFFEIIKYPIIDMSNPGIYRHLPWAKEGTLSDQRGGWSPGKGEAEEIQLPQLPKDKKV